MMERLLLAFAIVAAMWTAYQALTRLVLLLRARRGLRIDAYHLGRPAILYFTAPGCSPCETIQRPALLQLKALYGDRLQLIEVDASQHPGLADSWGVLTVPTTFLVDRQARPRGVNHGVARAGRLMDQLIAIDEPPPQRTLPAEAGASR